MSCILLGGYTWLFAGTFDMAAVTSATTYAQRDRTGVIGT